jgi:hypothetical protein
MSWAERANDVQMKVSNNTQSTNGSERHRMTPFCKEKTLKLESVARDDARWAGMLLVARLNLATRLSG